jgi:ABC-type Fe3+ transport system substrate-binding protein
MLRCAQHDGRLARRVLIMSRFLPILLLALIIALPFALRPRTEPASHWKPNDPRLVIVTPHNEAIRYEFERAFSQWHQKNHGLPVKIEWRAVGGTTEIMRFLASEYAANARVWWTRTLKKPWPTTATEALTATTPPTDPQLAELWHAFRKTDDPNAVTSRIDVFFGGGEFDHSTAYRQGLTVEPWPKGQEPTNLFYFQSGIALIPEKLSGETWRTPYLLGNVISTFGICYNLDRLKDLGIRTPPTTWDDLANPAYFKQVGAADPTKSGSVAKAFEMIIHQKIYQSVRRAGYSDKQIATNETAIDAYIKTKGKDYKRGDVPDSLRPYQQAVEQGWLDGLHLVQLIGANARYFTDSSQKVPIDVSVGDAAAGMTIDFYGRYQSQATIAEGGSPRMAYLTPKGGSSVSCDPISLLRGAPSRAVAVRFIGFTLSEEGQKLWCYKPGEPASAGGPEKYYLRRLPIRRDFYPSTNPTIQKRHEEHLKHSADNLADPQINPYALADTFTYYPRWTSSHFAIQRDLVRVMCMDSGDELKEAWQAILKSGGPQANPAVMQKLQRLPTLTLNGTPIQISWPTAPDLLKKHDRLELTREWTKAFRETYRRAAELASAPTHN